MGYDIPGVGSDPNKRVTLTDPVLKGVVDYQGQMSAGGVLLTAIPADINLLAGFVAASFIPVKVFEKEITCAQGTATVTALCVVPAGSVILDVAVICTEAFNGATTKTFEVGISGNTDKYIDPSDCPVTLAGVMDIFIGTNQDQKTFETLGAAMTLQAVHTNTTTATTGKMKVRVIYA